MSLIRSRIFAAVGRIAPQLPRFRGRTRAFLLLFNALGLRSQHVLVDAFLKDPTPYRARLDLHSWLQRIAFLSGGYEGDTVSFLVKLHQRVGRAGYLLDIGANIGLISIPAALLIQKGDGASLPPGPCVVSVEAVADNAGALKHQIAINGAEHLVAIIETALGEKVGTVEIQVEGDLRQGEGTGTANILPAGSTLDPNGTYECVHTALQVSTLDTLLKSGELSSHCSVVKIDTDGYDLKILQGGILFLQACRPLKFGEFSAHCMRWHGQSIDDVVELAATINYKVWQRVPGIAWKFSERVISSTYIQDLLLVPTELAGRFEWCLESPTRVRG